jgi:hypothetical protein
MTGAASWRYGARRCPDPVAQRFRSHLIGYRRKIIASVSGRGAKRWRVGVAGEQCIHVHLPVHRGMLMSVPDPNRAASAPTTRLSDDQQDTYVAIWAKAVETQMHFNEMSVKSRQFGLAFVAAALGLGILLLSRGQEFTITIPILGGFQLHATVLVVLSGAFALYAVSILDLNVYHKMLRGAVCFGEDFEQNYMKQIFDLEKGMTQAISHFSRFEDAVVTSNADGRYQYRGTKRKNALAKIRTFYRVSIGILIVTALLLFILTAHFGQLK